MNANQKEENTEYLCRQLNQMQEQIQIVSQNMIRMISDYKIFIESNDESLQVFENLRESVQMMLDNMQYMQQQFNEIKTKLKDEANQILLPPQNTAFVKYFDNQINNLIKMQMDKVITVINQNVDTFELQPITIKVDERNDQDQESSSEKMSMQQDDSDL